MSFIQRELERIDNQIQEILNLPQSHDASDLQPTLSLNNLVMKDELYAAKQALAWALDPQCYQSPYNMIMGITESIPPPKDKPQIQPSIVGNSPSYRAG